MRLAVSGRREGKGGRGRSRTRLQQPFNRTGVLTRTRRMMRWKAGEPGILMTKSSFANGSHLDRLCTPPITEP